MTAEDLRKEAAAAEFLSKVVSYGRDKERLTARALELRAQADAMDAAAADTSTEGKAADAKGGGRVA